MLNKLKREKSKTVSIQNSHNTSKWWITQRRPDRPEGGSGPSTPHQYTAHAHTEQRSYKISWAVLKNVSLGGSVVRLKVVSLFVQRTRWSINHDRRCFNIIRLSIRHVSTDRTFAPVRLCHCNKLLKTKHCFVRIWCWTMSKIAHNLLDCWQWLDQGSNGKTKTKSRQ